MKKHKQVMDEVRLIGGMRLSPVEILKEDHEKVKKLFKQFEQAESDSEKEKIVSETLEALKIHSIVEEEIFYPSFREHLSEEDDIDKKMDEALEEHHSFELMIQELEEMRPGDERYDAKFTVLSEYVKHHILEEESEMLSRVRDEDEDWQQIAEEMAQRKEELETEFKHHHAVIPEIEDVRHPRKHSRGQRRSRMKHH